MVEGVLSSKTALPGRAFSGASKGSTIAEERTGGAQME